MWSANNIKLTLSTMVDILTLVSLHHGDRVATVLLVESACSRAAVSTHAVIGVVVVSAVLFSFDTRQSQEGTLCVSYFVT